VHLLSIAKEIPVDLMGTALSARITSPGRSCHASLIPPRGRRRAIETRLSDALTIPIRVRA
jgi:hypothetical protein